MSTRLLQNTATLWKRCAKGGNTVEVQVKCSVANCKYYSNLECTAEAIEVNCDNSSMLASDSPETCCDTFTPVEDRGE